MSKWSRIGALIASVILSLVCQFVPDVPAVLEWESYITTFILTVWNIWKNNDFTLAAKVGTEVMHAIKDGKITIDEVKQILNTKKDKE